MATLLVEDSFCGTVTDATETSSNLASTTSTPPTTVADSSSLHSASPKREVAPPIVEPSPSQTDTATPSRLRARGPRPCYNLAQLVGTAGHGLRSAKGDNVDEERRRRRAEIASAKLLAATAAAAELTAPTPTAATPTAVTHIKQEPVSPKRLPLPPSPLALAPAPPPPPPAEENHTRATVDPVTLQESLRPLVTPRTRSQAHESPVAQKSQRTRTLRRSTRAATVAASAPPPASTTPVSNLGSKLAKFGKRGRKAVDKQPSSMTRELMRLRDTNEFAHIDDRPVAYTVWSNGKFVDPNAPEPTPRKKRAKEPVQEEPEEVAEEPITTIKKRRAKKFLDRGLYSGQDTPQDVSAGLSKQEKKKLASIPELKPSGRVNKTMPMPLFAGLRTLVNGRDFKLPYHVCNPLPPGQPKPDEWKRMTKNRFIGESKDYWRKSPHFHDYQSKCVCTPEDGCGESCQNRIMLYECDEMNCNVGKGICQNRAFANLTARRAKGGKYRVGVEVIKTSDRGYGVRSNRCFQPNQIIMEYAGEIITEEECERRMTEVYKNNDCYYLMSFDQNMIIDATTGSIARFVNHSCNPNCRMIKWIVSGQPRMALFAGDRPIMTGEELTYDYNFDPFSAKNVQKCLCGEPNCRGILGPKNREPKPAKDVRAAVKATVRAGKRKLKELIGDGEREDGRSKKRRIHAAKGVSRSLSSAGSKAKGAVSAIRKAVTTTTTTKKTVLSRSAVNRRASTGSIQKTTKKKTTTSNSTSTSTSKRLVRTVSKASSAKQAAERGPKITLAPDQDKGQKGGGLRRIIIKSKTTTTTPLKAVVPPRPVRTRYSTGRLRSRRSGVEISRGDIFDFDESD